MGEHKTNRTAVIRAMLPAFPTGSDFTNVQLRAGFNLRTNLLIVPPEKMRTADDGSIEILAKAAPDAAEDTWSKPEGFEVIAEGTKLGYEHLDYVVHLMGSCVTRSLVSRNGEHPMTLVPVQEVFRMPAALFLRNFMQESAKPNGETPSMLVTG